MKLILNKNKEIKEIVKQSYGKIAIGEKGSCCGADSCCDTTNISQDVGYKKKDLLKIPRGANLGLGCGNPVAFAMIKKGETVLDLGSGAGIDCFLAANKVGPTGKVIGIDMTPQMIKKARQNAKKGNYKNVKFILGEIEKLPLKNSSIDVVISNCVINLSLEKEKVFNEIYRVLKVGGRMIISDIVLLKPLSLKIKKSVEAYIGCLSGAVLKKEYLGYIKSAGFKQVSILSETTFPINLMSNDSSAKVVMKDFNITKKEISTLNRTVVSMKLFAIKE